MNGFFNRVRRRISPAQTLVIGALGLILLGGALLSLPSASADGSSMGFLRALFTSTSAVCVTGLTLVDTGTHFTLFGQLIILALIQVGGLGFMALATLFYLLIGKRITLRERLVIQASLNAEGLQGAVRHMRGMLLSAAAIEAVGALLLSIRFIPRFGWAKGIYWAIFHSISAFCNAGFDLFDVGESLTSFKGDPIVNLTIMVLVVLGGIGFSVFWALFRTPFKKLALHAKLVLIVSGALIALGALAFVAIEWNNPRTLGDGSLSAPGKIMAALFQSVSMRTAGFASIDQRALWDGSKIVAAALMFIGASPASTGGGIKTTTFALIALMVINAVRGREEIQLFGRRVSKQDVTRALTVGALALALVTAAAIVLVQVEQHNAAFNSIDMILETVSAFSTTGLPLGITPALHPLSKALLAALMFAGRLGPLTLTIALAAAQGADKRHIHYPQERLMVG